MKLRNRSLTFFAMLLIGTAALLGACATTSVDQPQSGQSDQSIKTRKSIQELMQEVDKEVSEMIVQVDATAASLDSLIKAGQPDLKKAFDTYYYDLAKLDTQYNRVTERIGGMNARRTEYFTEWEKRGDTYKNPQIQKLSAQRRTELAQIFAHLFEANVGTKRTYQAYVSNLKEIQRYLSNDLTPKGTAYIAPVAEKTVQDRDVLKTSLNAVRSALDEIKTEFELIRK